MKPLLASLPPKRRTLLFAPVALGAFFFLFILLAIVTDHFLLTAILTPPLAVGAAYALVGWPVVVRKDGKPVVPTHVKPWLFFAIAPVSAALLYPLFGVILTNFGVPTGIIAIVSIALALTSGIAIAYYTVGFPPLVRMSRTQWEKLPAERRPFLFFPLAVVLFLVFYLTLGVASTRYAVGLGPLLFDLQVLVVLPLSLILGCLAAYLFVGFPKPSRPAAEYIPKVTGRRRPQAFLITFLLLGIPLTLVFGLLLSNVTVFLPDELVLPLAILLGFATSLGLAALAWGTPAKWRTYADYKPGLPAHTRIPLLVFGVLATIVVVTVVFSLAGADIFWGLLTGMALGILLGLKMSGATRKIAERRHAETLLPDLPDRVKPIVLFPLWFLTTGLLFTILTYVLPDLVAINFLIAFCVGLIASFLFVEESLLREAMAERRREREKRKAFQKRRADRLAGRQPEGSDDAPGGT